ncbi:hypothetical protein F5882DRAFT_53132 [Hyaloscypha sp. PMI_1271]|nr:hypothetical protein F5882DRAFT_53132 [Hyaloscypha sp. PMI_1271]
MLKAEFLGMRLFGRKELVLQLCVAAFGVRGAAAALAFTGSLDGLTAGAPFDVKWSGAIGTSTLTLLSGSTVVNKIAFGISDQHLLWSPYAFTPAGSYILQLGDTSGQTATSKFTMLAAGTNPSSTALHFTNTEFDITAGAPFNVTWTGAQGTTSLSLQQGDANSIKTADVILSSITDDFVVWTPYATTEPGSYILRLDDSSNDFAYSLVFNMQAEGSGSPSTSTSSSTSTPTPTPTNSAGTGTSTNTSTTPINAPSQSNAQNNQTTSPIPNLGAKAGIGIACSLAIIFLLTTLYLLYRQWRQKRDVVELSGTSSAGSLGFGHRGVNGYFTPGENGNGGVVEKGSTERENIAEMRGEGRVEELDGYGGRGVV